MRIQLLLFINLLFFSNFSHAQVCTGNLGNNIFLEGDFGEGSANLLSPDPNIAPGYNYTFNVPPVDGQYVITNNTGTWPGLYTSWLAIGDNSNDSDGYMMVVNASNSPGLFYTQEVDGLCEGTLYEFTADIINLIRLGVADHIAPNVTFLLDGVELFSTGDIPQNQNWETYGATFTTAAGQESVTLSLRNNAPGGIGNDLALDNISFRPCGPEALILPDEIANICEDGAPILLEATVIGSQYNNPAFQWQTSTDEGFTWMDIVGETSDTYLHTDFTSGMYYYRFLLADGAGNLGSDKCRVNSNIKIINVIPKEVMMTDTICNGGTIMVGSSTYSVSGIYIDSLVNSLGCDSILTTNLTVLPDAGITADFIINEPSCYNTSDGNITIENIANGVPPYQISFDGIDFGAANFFPDLAGDSTYLIKISDFFDCFSETPIYLENAEELALELGENQVIELGETVEISPFYNFMVNDFEWTSITPIDCIDFDDCQKFDFLPTTSQYVSLNLSSESGCSITDSLLIEVIEVRKAYFPNIFSPNNDGINDVFTLFGDIPNVQMVEDLKVFDRWGSLIFDAANFLPNDIQNGWNGTFNGKALPMGIYVYTARVRFVDDEIFRYSGDVFLIK